MRLVNFVKAVLKEFGQDKVGQMSAAFAYTALFSIGPLLLVVISVVGFVLGAKAASGQLFDSLAGVVGADTARTLQDLVAALHKSSNGVFALVIGLIGTLLGAAAISTQLQNSFDTIFRVVPDPAGGIKRTLYIKLKNVLLVLLGSLAVAASAAASTILTNISGRVADTLNMPTVVLEPVNSIVSLLVFTVLLYGVYRLIPNAQIPRRNALAAGLVIAVLFLIGKYVLALVIGNNGTASAYGAAASLITLLLWVYYSSQIMFIGAEGLKVYAYHRSQEYMPKRFALKRETIDLDGEGLSNKLLQSFVRGLRKGTGKQYTSRR